MMWDQQSLAIDRDFRQDFSLGIYRLIIDFYAPPPVYRHDVSHIADTATPPHIAAGSHHIFSSPPQHRALMLRQGT